ncbi:MAG TPA: RDD family protein, partial [Gammaproteobacteria bacterium]
ARSGGGVFKRVMHAVVVNKQGKALSFRKALWRNLLKLLLLPFAPLSFYALSKDFRRQALHDKLSGSFVMWTPDVIAASEPESSYQVDIKS